MQALEEKQAMEKTLAGKPDADSEPDKGSKPDGASSSEPATGSCVRIGMERKGPANPLCLYVIDNGPGIPAEEQTRIFDPHFTTRSTGTGLGLAICKRLSEAMGCKLGVSSEPGKGARFDLVFPAIGAE